MTNFSDMLTKAKAMQDKMKEAQEKIKNIEVEGFGGGNLVKVILTGDYELKSIIISEEAKKEDQEIINDLIVAAYNNAKENLKGKNIKKEKDMIVVEQRIIVEKESQKAIIIGQGGSKIKDIGSRSRVDMEKVFKKKVFLDLRVLKK